MKHRPKLDQEEEGTMTSILQDSLWMLLSFKNTHVDSVTSGSHLRMNLMITCLLTSSSLKIKPISIMVKRKSRSRNFNFLHKYKEGDL